MRAIVTNGQKGLQLEDLDDLTDPYNWYFLQPPSEQDALFSRVAAAYRAATMTAEAVASLPFALVTAAGEDYDASDDWQNKVGFLQKPRQLFMRLELSLFFTNSAYCRYGRNIARVPKNLYYLVPSSIRPITNAQTGELVKLERYANGVKVAEYAPDDPELVRIWYLDHTTELLPSQNTRAKAAMAAAGIMFAQDYWVKNFFERGGVKPSLIAVKGNMSKEKVDAEEKAWTKFIKNVSQRLARVFNADALTVEPFGSGIEDLKDNEVYNQALANIAVAAGMPLSLLLANSANYATAQTEYSSWFRNRVTPDADFLAEELNEQVFSQMGLRLEFRPENTDPEQEDEVARAQSVNTFMDFFIKCPSYEVFIGATTVFGYELTQEMDAAAKQYYADKEKKAQELEKQMQQQGIQPALPGQPKPFQPREENAITKWVSNIKQLKDLRVWCEIAVKRFKRGQPLDFDYISHYDGIPDEVTNYIKARLHFAQSTTDIINLFEEFNLKDEPTPPTQDNDGLKAVAVELEKIAAQPVRSQVPIVPRVDIHMAPINLTTQMPEQGQVVVNIPEQPAPVVNVSVPEQPAPVVNVAAPTVQITQEAQEPPVVNVNVPKPAPVTVQRDGLGKITGLKPEGA